MKYIQHINDLIVKKTSATERLVLFGQNIAAGSCISGLTRNLKVGEGGLIINATNSESTLAGLGFGMMLGGTSSIFFMKQLDFLLLGIDQLVHSYNFVRRKAPKASYTIVPVLSDLGWHGLQSSFNNFGDLCSIARIPGFVVTNKADSEEIFNTHLISPGFRIISVPQRLFPLELLDIETTFINKDKTLFQYKKGSGATIVCFNATFPQGLELHNKLKEKDVEASLFSVNSVTPIDWSEIIADTEKTKKIVILDDSKSNNVPHDNLLAVLLQKTKLDRTIVLKRDLTGNDWLFPNLDILEVNYDEVVKALS